MLGLLRVRNARFYLLGEFVSIFGDVALWLALGIWVKSLTGSNSAAGLVFFAFALPTLASPVSGVFVDRFRRRPLLIGTDLFLGCLVLLLTLVHGRSSIWLIYVVMVFYGLAFNVLSSAGAAFLPSILDSELLPHGNAALQVGRQGLRLLGPLMGAGLFAWRGGAFVAVFDAATFGVAAVALALIRVEEIKPSPSESHWLSQALSGIRHVLKTTVIRQVVIAIVIAVIVVGFLESLIFAIVAQGLHRPPAFLGLVISVQGIGGILGGLTAAKLMERTGEGILAAIGLGLFACGAPLLALSSLPAVITGIVIFGLGLPWLIVGATTLVQRVTPANLHGRSFAALDLLIGGPQTFSIALGAALVAVVDYRALLLIMAAVVAVACLYLATRPEQWARARRHPNAPTGTTAEVAPHAVEP